MSLHLVFSFAKQQLRHDPTGAREKRSILGKFIKYQTLPLTSRPSRRMFNGARVRPGLRITSAVFTEPRAESSKLPHETLNEKHPPSRGLFDAPHNDNAGPMARWCRGSVRSHVHASGGRYRTVHHHPG